MAWGSSVPTVLQALVSTLRGAPALEGVPVFDGPALDGTSQDAVVTIGYTGDPEDPGTVSGQNEYEGLSTARSREQYTVRCAVSVRDGTGDPVAPRTRAFELLSVVGGVLAANPSLGGACMQAGIGAWSLIDDQATTGAVATIAFSIDIDAFTYR
jgi:hypothetical protein